MAGLESRRVEARKEACLMGCLTALVLLSFAHVLFWPGLLVLPILLFIGFGGVLRSLLWIVGIIAGSCTPTPS